MQSLHLKTAVILAAGMGTRLQPYTDTKPKCLVEVNGKPMLAHTIDALESNGFERLLIVTGYRADQVETFAQAYDTSLTIDTIHNELYDSTNNIYSLWMIRPEIDEDFLLVESDIVLEPQILEQFQWGDSIALDLFDPARHDGTTATVNNDEFLEQLYIKKNPPADRSIYKTVNIYSFSAGVWATLFDKIDKSIRKGDVNGFYETAIRDLRLENRIDLRMVNFSDIWWDEVDDPDDLKRTERHLQKFPHLLTNTHNSEPA
jgi:L-glutamine-phosphate cytidylyltransferase